MLFRQVYDFVYQKSTDISCVTDLTCLDRHFKLVHKLEPKYCRPCKKIFEASAIGQHKCTDPKLFEENNLRKEWERINGGSKGGSKSRETSPEVFKTPDLPLAAISPNKGQRTPTKSDKSSPASFYSSRYRDLLHQFSPTSMGKKQSAPNLVELLAKCANRKGKLELNYVTPKQMEAVTRFVQGDNTVEKVEMIEH